MFSTLSIALALFGQVQDETQVIHDSYTQMVRKAHVKMSIVKMGASGSADLMPGLFEPVCDIEADIPVYAHTVTPGTVYVALENLPNCETMLIQKLNQKPVKVALKSYGRILIREQEGLDSLKFYLATMMILNSAGTKEVREHIVLSAATKKETDYLQIEGSSQGRRGGDSLHFSIEFSDTAASK